MTCTDREQDLLLLAHGRLSAGRRLLIQSHLRRCPQCSERLEQLRLVSGLVADVFRGPDMPSWATQSAARQTLAVSAPVRVFLIAGIALVLFVLGFMTVRLLVPQSDVLPRAGQTTRPSEEDCRPGLPNDRCR